MLSVAEDIMDAFEVFTESNLSTYLTAIATEKRDGKTPADLNDVLTGIYDPTKYNNFPLGFLVPVSEEYEALSLSEDAVTFTMHFWIIDRGYGEADLTTRVARMSSAFRSMVRAMAVPSTIGEAIVTSIEYYPRIYGVEEAQGARIEVEITQEV